MNNSTMEIMHRGMRILINAMGNVEAEQFVSLINREKFDYTKWQRNYFSEISPEDFMENSVQFEKDNPYSGTGKVVE